MYIVLGRFAVFGVPFQMCEELVYTMLKWFGDCSNNGKENAENHLFHSKEKNRFTEVSIFKEPFLVNYMAKFNQINYIC